MVRATAAASEQTGGLAARVLRYDARASGVAPALAPLSPRHSLRPPRGFRRQTGASLKVLAVRMDPVSIPRHGLEISRLLRIADREAQTA